MILPQPQEQFEVLKEEKVNQSEDDDWALFVMQKNDEFKNAMSCIATTPFVFMQPVADLEIEAAPKLMKDIVNSLGMARDF